VSSIDKLAQGKISRQEYRRYGEHSSHLRIFEDQEVKNTETKIMIFNMNVKTPLVWVRKLENHKSNLQETTGVYKQMPAHNF
jgi:hypothetical protein